MNLTIDNDTVILYLAKIGIYMNFHTHFINLIQKWMIYLEVDVQIMLPTRQLEINLSFLVGIYIYIYIYEILSVMKFNWFPCWWMYSRKKYLNIRKPKTRTKYKQYKYKYKYKKNRNKNETDLCPWVLAHKVTVFYPSAQWPWSFWAYMELKTIQKAALDAPRVKWFN